MKPQSFEAKVRRLATRTGLRLCKSRTRNVDEVTFGLYHLVDNSTNSVVFGSYPFAYNATLEECAEFLTK